MRIPIFVPIVLIVLSGCKVELNAGLRETEANEMMSKLLAYNISASKKPGKEGLVTLYVEESDFGKAVDLLKKFGLPRPEYATMGDVFANSGLVASPTQEWARVVYARSQELSKTISSFPGVISAEVHIASPRKDEPFSEAPPPSVSVSVLVQRDAIRSDLIPQIKELVAFSVENATYDRVAVVVSPVDPPPVRERASVDVAGITLDKASLPRVAALLGVAGTVLASIAVGLTIVVHLLLRKRREAN